MIESLAHALARGATPSAEVLGYGLSLRRPPHDDPTPAATGWRRDGGGAGRRAGCRRRVDYVSAHGTGTPVNDIVETRAIERVFGRRAAELPVSSVKSMLGHTMGAASAIETIVCAMAVYAGIAPPTIHYETPDPECRPRLRAEPRPLRCRSTSRSTTRWRSAV